MLSPVVSCFCTKGRWISNVWVVNVPTCSCVGVFAFVLGDQCGNHNLVYPQSVRTQSSPNEDVNAD